MSFRLKTILGIALIELILLSILVYSSLQYLRTSNENQFYQRAETTARLIATMTSDALVALDLATLDTLVNQTLLNKDVVYLRIFNKNDTVVAKGGKENALLKPFQVETSLDHALTDGLFHAQSDILIAGSYIGKVQLGLDIAVYATLMKEARQRMLSVAITEIVLVALFGFLLGHVLTKRLAALQVGAKAVAKGDFGHLITVRGKDELADTAISFNQMSVSLEKFARELQEAKLKAEEGQERAESILQSAINSIDSGMVIVGEDGEVELVNHAFEPLWAEMGQEVKELVSMHPQAEELKEKRHVISISSGEKDYLQWTEEHENNRYVLISRHVMDIGGHAIITTDVSSIYEAEERERKLQRDLLQSQKLEALGTLAGGIAHEINTPIQYIGDNLRFLEDSAKQIGEVFQLYQKLAEQNKEGEHHQLAAQCLEKFEEAEVDYLLEESAVAASESIAGVKQVSNIVIAMKEFSHPSNKTKVAVDVNKVIERSAIVCRNEWKHAAELSFDFDEGMPAIPAFEGELNQVILNLIVNAAHAIGEKGGTGNKISISTSFDEKNAFIEVSDTGTGIAEKIRERIFEPFFTTKDVGKGSGQGLAICHDAIVNKHQGSLEVISEENEGTTFKITLPRTQQEE